MLFGCNIDEQLKHVHKVVDIAEGAKRKVCVTLLRYKEDNPEFIFLLDVMDSVCDQVLDNKPHCNIV